MGEQLQPDTLAATVADLERRLRVLESTQRVGLNRVIAATQTAAVDPSAYGTFESGAVGNTWEGSDGSSGTGYPAVTIETGTRVLLIATLRPTGLAVNAALYRSSAAVFGVGVDGATPGAATQRLVEQYNTAIVEQPITWAVVVAATQGTHTYKMWASWYDDVPAAPYLPRFTDGSLIVLPLTA